MYNPALDSGVFQAGFIGGLDNDAGTILGAERSGAFSKRWSQIDS
jgi:hypothetical protein